MTVQFKRGATQTGGSDVVLVPAGYNPGKAVFHDPASIRLTPRTATFTTGVSGATANSQGIARAGLRYVYSNKTMEEGCCTLQTGQAVIDIGMSWSMNQANSIPMAALADVRGIIYQQWFEDLWIKGILPA